MGPMRLTLLSVALCACGGGLVHYKPPPTTSPDGGPTEDSGSTEESTPTTTTPTTTDTGTPPTTTTPPAFQPELDSVEPDFASDAGGDELVLNGSFDQNTDVFVDGAAARIVDYRASRLTIEAPPGSPGWVDVEVVSGSESAVVHSALQYFEDGYGKAGTVGNVSYLEYFGDYWDVPNPPPLAWAWVAFVEPTTWDAQRDYAPVLGQCRYNYVSPETYTERLPGASQLDITGTRTVHLPDATADGSPGWYGDGALRPDIDIVPNTGYDLATIAGDANWPEFDRPALVRVPGSFRVTNPNLGAANLPDVTRSLSLSWTGSGGDYVLIYLGRTTSTGVADGYVTCAVQDTGSFTVPANTWPNWYRNGILYVQVGRVKVAYNEIPYDHSENRVAGIYWAYGAGVTQ